MTDQTEMQARIEALEAENGRVQKERDTLHKALCDLYFAVCGVNGFADCVRADSGKPYPWPALDKAEAQALAALKGEGE